MPEKIVTETTNDAPCLDLLNRVSHNTHIKVTAVWITTHWVILVYKKSNVKNDIAIHTVNIESNITDRHIQNWLMLEVTFWIQYEFYFINRKWKAPINKDMDN